MTTDEIIRPIITDTYGDNGMSRALVTHLAQKIEKWPNEQPTYGSASREDMVRLTVWDWFSGGTTAAKVAEQIEGALNGA